jgi:phospholipid/cholesterol/gamma-HCH transport system permease protein
MKPITSEKITGLTTPMKILPNIRWARTFANIFIGLVKPVIFSLVIAFIACYKGFRAVGGTKGVGRATTESVVLASITLLIVNFFVTRVIFPFIKGWM